MRFRYTNPRHIAAFFSAISAVAAPPSVGGEQRSRVDLFTAHIARLNAHWVKRKDAE